MTSIAWGREKAHGGQDINPAFVAATVIVVPLAIVMIGAIWSDLKTTRRDKADGVLASWAGLRLTRRELIMGYGADAAHIPLAGLHAAVVDYRQARPLRRIQLSVEGRGTAIHRRQPYSEGASTEARKLALLLNKLRPAGSRTPPAHPKPRSRPLDRLAEQSV